MQYIVNELTVDTLSHEIHRGDNEIFLSKKEYLLLVKLMENKNIVLDRRILAEAMEYKNYCKASNIVDVYINYLRKKIDKGFKKKLIITIRDFGYKIKG